VYTYTFIHYIVVIFIYPCFIKLYKFMSDH